ncbi:MAG: hypothetical protein IMZ55_11245, partial [Acidobacteria bacterium]|nr:hypothetical protein [Acidobacteriota bacterium]
MHQWITKEAFDFLAAQVGDTEFADYLTKPGLTSDSAWTEIASASRIYNGDNNLIEGSRDEDGNRVNYNPPPQNPFGQDFQWDRHYSHGGDDGELTDGLTTLFGDAFDEADSYFSAYEQAQHYFYGHDGFPGVVGYYPSSPALAYYYLGHVAHLLQDMTVPAHVHNDPHPPVFGPDHYESWVADNEHFKQWGCGNGERGGPSVLGAYASLEELFRATADYTEEYPSCDTSG